MALSKVGLVEPIDSMTVSGTTPTLTIGDAGAEDAKIVFDGNAQDYHIGLDDSADTLVIGKGSALGTTTAMSFDANGIITKPLQPAFHVVKNANQENLANDGEVTITFEVAVYDQNSDFDLTNNRFVAPVTGKYFLTARVRLDALDTAPDYYVTKIVTSNRSYINIMNPDFTGDGSFHSQEITVLADMDASDTAILQVQQSGGTAQTDVPTSTSYTYFTGFLAC